jgi:hypothetical protein
MNITAKINLRQLKSHVMTMKSKTGADIKCLVLPIELNHLYEGEKGIYIDLQGYELKERREGQKDTHLVKQNLPKEVYDAMTNEEKQNLPILGNMTVWGRVEPELQEYCGEEI